MHVEGDCGAGGGLLPAALQQVVGQACGEVGLARAAGATEDEASVLEQQADVVLQHGPGDERLKHQAVHTLLPQACTYTDRHADG